LSKKSREGRDPPSSQAMRKKAVSRSGAVLDVSAEMNVFAGEA
jgi:hypothetical protein